MLTHQPKEPHGLRDALQKRPWLAAVIILPAIAFFTWYNLVPEPGPRAYFTTDDGATFFADKQVVPPFTRGGKEAVGAVVFSCDGGKTKFVGYLVRYTAKGKAELEEEIRTGIIHPGNEGAEYKRPGDPSWTAEEDVKSAAIRRATGRPFSGKTVQEIKDVRCPDGKSGPLMAMSPEAG